MSASPLQLMTTPNGDLLSASVGGDGPSLTVARDTFDTGLRSSLTFTQGPDTLLVLTGEIAYSESGTIVRSSLTADGPQVRYRLTLDFAEDPGAFFSGGKLQAMVTVEGAGGDAHHGRFDGDIWHPVGLDDAPTLAGVLRDGPGPRIAPLRPALDVLVAHLQRASGDAFSPTPGRPPSLPMAAPGSLQPLSWRGRLCKMACAAASAATAAACCGATGVETGGAGCVACSAGAAAMGANCAENCD
jgi:hypothetical protein